LPCAMPIEVRGRTAAALELVPELGQLLEVALQGAVADTELPGQVGGGARAGGEERGEAQEAGGLAGSAGGHGGVRVRRTALTWRTPA